MIANLSASDIWSDVIAVRQKAPLVHSITNMVAMNINANVLLAAGASPVMSHAHEEIRDMVGIVEALVLNIGTLDAYWVESMKMALAAATQRCIPKTDTKNAWGIDGLVEVRAFSRLPLVAIGGIAAEQFAQIQATGVGSIAVVRALVNAPDPEAAAAQLSVD